MMVLLLVYYPIESGDGTDFLVKWKAFELIGLEENWRWWRDAVDNQHWCQLRLRLEDGEKFCKEWEIWGLQVILVTMWYFFRLRRTKLVSFLKSHFWAKERDVVCSSIYWGEQRRCVEGVWHVCSFLMCAQAGIWQRKWLCRCGGTSSWESEIWACLGHVEEPFAELSLPILWVDNCYCSMSLIMRKVENMWLIYLLFGNMLKTTGRPFLSTIGEIKQSAW